MKEGWEYKKLGEVAEIQYGTRVVQKRDGGSIYPVYGGGGATFKMDTYNRENCLVVARFAMSPKCTRIVSGKFFLNDSGLTLKSIDSNTLSQEYLEKNILGHNDEIYLLSNGMAQKNLDMKAFRNLLIKYPTSLSKQQKIVSELDLLSGVIEKQKAQLEELDKLAQSIFYDMFGDPVTNEKGWAVIQLGDKCEVTSFKRVLIEEVVEEGIPFIRGTELTALSKMTNSENYEFSLFITPEHYERVKAISGVPSVGDLLIPSINADGNIWILDTSKPRYYKDGRVLWVHVNHDVYTSSALKYIMQVLLKDTYSDMASGATFAELKLFVLREMKIILPPLSLQQEFAAKVEAIEAMKAKVRLSLKEAETLFNSRMDYYFN